MKRPLAYITAAWFGGDSENAELAAQYCRAVYEAGFAPICPALYLPLFLNDAVPEEHKSGIDIGRDLLRRSRVLVVCGHTVTESMNVDYAVYKTGPDKYLLFFKSGQADAITACFSEYSRRVLDKAKTDRVPIREQLKRAAAEILRQPAPQRKDRVKEAAHEDR